MNWEKQIAVAFQWIRDNQERFWAITGSLFLVVLFSVLVLHHRGTQNDEAWTELGNIQGQLTQGQLAEARKNLDAWQTRFHSSDAVTYAKFMKADLLYRTSDYVQSAQVYGEIVQTGQPDIVRPLALSAQAAAEEMAGHLPEAQALLQTFLDKYPDHFLSAPQYMSQARLAEMAANSAAAAAIYDRFIVLYPQSPWTELAKTRLQALGKLTPK